MGNKIPKELKYEQVKDLELESRVKYVSAKEDGHYFVIVDGVNLYHRFAGSYSFIAKNFNEDKCMWKEIAEGDDRKREKNIKNAITLEEGKKCYDCDGTFHKGIGLDCAEYISNSSFD